MTTLVSARWIVAHQGGWDEILLFAGPVVLAIVAVRWAERRAQAKRDGSQEIAVDEDASET